MIVERRDSPVNNWLFYITYGLDDKSSLIFIRRLFQNSLEQKLHLEGSEKDNNLSDKLE